VGFGFPMEPPQARTWYQVKWFWTRGDKDKQGENLEAVKGV